MATLITVATMIVCVLLALVILVQNSKGGGLASNFSSGNQIMSVKKTADTLENATWGLAMGLLVLSLVSAMVLSKGDIIEDESKLKDVYESAPIVQIPATPTPQ